MSVIASIVRYGAVAGATSLLAWGCADDGPGVVSDATSLATLPPAAVALDGVPVLADATALQSPSGQQGATTVSYRSDDESAEEVLSFYADELAARGWSVADPVVETSADVWRGDWVKDGRRLQVVASPMTLGAASAASTQFNLIMLDDRTDITVAAPPNEDTGA